MQPRIDVIALAVGDLDWAPSPTATVSVWESPEVAGTEFAVTTRSRAEAVAMFQLQGGLILLSTRAQR